MNVHAALPAVLLLLAAACARESQKREMAVPPAPSLKPECGEASYYHRSLAGNLTANGETYDPAAMTAAHNSLPFDTQVLVRRRPDENSDGETGKPPQTVRVRINDRGPFAGNRIIDLSPAAAKEIGMFGEDGVAEVCLVTLSPSSEM